MPASFGFRHATIAAGTNPARVAALRADSQRIAIAVALTAVTNCVLYNAAGTQLTGIIAILRGPSTLIMPYRDWGEIIRQEISIGCDAAGTSVYVVDLFRLPVGG